MNVVRTKIDGLLIIEPDVFGDDRGYFFESFNKNKWSTYFKNPPVFVQDNESLSHKGVLRGLHYQSPPFGQAKLVRVVKGAVLDVAVDIRSNSPTYGQHLAVRLTEDNKKQFFIPEGFAHGFLTLEDNTIFSYKCTNFYNVQSEGGLSWNDPVLNIDWGIDSPLISVKDGKYTEFSNFNTPY